MVLTTRVAGSMMVQLTRDRYCLAALFPYLISFAVVGVAWLAADSSDGLLHRGAAMWLVGRFR